MALNMIKYLATMETSENDMPLDLMVVSSKVLSTQMLDVLITLLFTY